MRYLPLILTLGILLAPSLRADEYRDLPLTGDDLKRALDLNLQKYEINFDQPGIPSFKADGSSGPHVLSMTQRSKAVTLVVFIEEKSSTPDAWAASLHKLTFWFTSEGVTKSSYIFFESAKARVTTTQFKNGIFSIVARPSDNASEKPAYSVEVVNFK